MKTRATVFFVLVAGGLLVFGPSLQADLIDFESGFNRLDPVDTISTATNQVTFSTQGVDGTSPFVARVGTTPKNAFEVRVDGVLYGDTPQGGDPGVYFLTDGAGNKNNYLFDLAEPAGQFAVDLYDFAGDGGASPGDSATLHAYADSGRTNEVVSATYVVPQQPATDGLAVSLGVAAPSIMALTLEFSTFDRGTGIDNIRFVTVPEPSTAILAALGLLVGWFSFKRASSLGCGRRLA